jgi:tetraacyldisaccharide 4'-kinase
LNQQEYRKLISGKSHSMAAKAVRLLLRPISAIYKWVVCLRNLSYDKGWFKIHKTNATVISVGNITTGGTGKTPLVIWLSNKLSQKGLRTAILTRGYKLKKSKLSDEPAILAGSCPQARIIINPDRIAGAAEAQKKYDAEVLVMDDGFQHRRLHRDLDIVTIDATDPFGYGKIFPSGLLREPISSINRAHAAVITRCDLINGAELTQLEEKLKTANPDMVIAHAIHKPICAKSLEHKQIPLEKLKDRKIFAFSGIGNPDAFVRTLSKLGVKPVGSKAFNDHHSYCNECLTDIYEEARYLGADMVLTTQKDWTKTALKEHEKDILFAQLIVELSFVSGQEQLMGLVNEAIALKSSGQKTETDEIAG